MFENRSLCTLTFKNISRLLSGQMHPTRFLTFLKTDAMLKRKLTNPKNNSIMPRRKTSQAKIVVRKVHGIHINLSAFHFTFFLAGTFQYATSVSPLINLKINHRRQTQMEWWEIFSLWKCIKNFLSQHKICLFSCPKWQLRRQ